MTFPATARAAVLGFLSENPGTSINAVALHLGVSRWRASVVLTELQQLGNVYRCEPDNPKQPARWYLDEEEDSGEPQRVHWPVGTWSIDRASLPSRDVFSLSSL